MTMTVRRCSAVILVLLVLVLIGCGPAYISEETLPSANYVVVRADTLYELAMPQLYEMLCSSPVLPEGGVLAREEVRTFLDSMLCDTLVGIKASQIDLSQHYDQYRIYKLRYHRLLINRFLEEVVYKRVTIDSQEVVDFYHSRPDLFAVEEQVLLHQILCSPLGLKYGPDSLYYRRLSPEELDEAALEYARQVRRLLDFGEPFAAVAKAHSHDNTSAEVGGLVGWTSRNVYLDPFDSIAFSMKPGDVSQPYHDKSGWHILYVEDYQAEGIPELTEDQYAMARESLIQHKANRIGLPLRDSLLEHVELEFNEELLDTNVYLVEKSTWAAIVNGRDTMDFNELRTMEEPYRRQYDVDNTTVDMKKRMARNLSGKYAYVQAARAEGIDTLPDIVAEEAALRHKYARFIATAGRRPPVWRPTDSMVEEYYNDHIEEFRVAKPYRIQHIIVEDSLTGEFVRDQALAGVDFLDLAREFYPGEPSIRSDLADLGEIGPDDVPEPLFRAAQTTPVGGVSHPVKTRYGYHLVKVLSRADTLGVKDSWHTIADILKQQHSRELFRQFRDELYGEFNVRFVGLILPVHLQPLDRRGGSADAASP